MGVLTAAFPPEVVDLTIEPWDAREQRSRLLPARLVAYYVMAERAGATDHRFAGHSGRGRHEWRRAVAA